MEFLFVSVALVALVLFVAAPLLQESSGAESEPVTDVKAAREEKEVILSDLKDIEMDYRMGKLSDEDYQRLKTEFMAHAVEALEKLEKLEAQSRGKRKRKRRT